MNDELYQPYAIVNGEIFINNCITYQMLYWINKELLFSNCHLIKIIHLYKDISTEFSYNTTNINVQSVKSVRTVAKGTEVTFVVEKLSSL